MNLDLLDLLAELDAVADRLAPAPRLVLLAIARRCGTPDGCCWSSQLDVARLAGVDTRTVRAAVPALLRSGLIEPGERDGREGWHLGEVLRVRLRELADRRSGGSGIRPDQRSGDRIRDPAGGSGIRSEDQREPDQRSGRPDQGSGEADQRSGRPDQGSSEGCLKAAVRLPEVAAGSRARATPTDTGSSLDDQVSALLALQEAAGVAILPRDRRAVAEALAVGRSPEWIAALWASSAGWGLRDRRMAVILGPKFSDRHAEVDAEFAVTVLDEHPPAAAAADPPADPTLAAADAGETLPAAALDLVERLLDAPPEVADDLEHLPGVTAEVVERLRAERAAEHQAAVAERWRAAARGDPQLASRVWVALRRQLQPLGVGGGAVALLVAAARRRTAARAPPIGAELGPVHVEPQPEGVTP